MSQDSCKQLHQKQSMNFILKAGQNLGKSGKHFKLGKQHATGSKAGVSCVSIRGGGDAFT